ncbi:hypothetical protein GCM10009678_90000 [Actinomadura kijaniata]|uniref:hypothetical protein n=1 Tax=Actinomadura kijaniata TaxID=46161 RepID=UPI002FE92AE1
MSARDRAAARLMEEMLVRGRPAARPYPWTVVWRWRYELAAAGLAGGLWYAAGGWAVAALAVAGPVAAAAPAAREWAWVVVTPHRVRAACAELRIQNHRGRLPAVVRTSRAPYGERVLLWCPAGTAPEDFAAARRLMGSACWAGDVRVVADARRRQFVTLEVVRRGPGPSVVRVEPDAGREAGARREPGGRVPTGVAYGSRPR